MTNNQFIKSDSASVIQRQIDCGVYRPEQFIYSPYMSSYWSGHLIEELLEFINEDNPTLLAHEAADVIIFLQNLTAYLYPKEELVIDLNWPSCPVPFHKLLLCLRHHIPDRKTWKQYSDVDFILWNRRVVMPIIKFLLDFVDKKELQEAYESKMAYNQVREDWV